MSCRLALSSFQEFSAEPETHRTVAAVTLWYAAPSLSGRQCGLGHRVDLVVRGLPSVLYRRFMVVW